MKRCPRGEQRGKGKVVGKRSSRGEKVPEVSSKKRSLNTTATDSCAARFPAAAHLAVNNQRSRVSTGSTNKRILSKKQSTDNTQYSLHTSRSRAAWNAATILMFSPCGDIFRALPRGRAIYIDSKGVPGYTKEIGGASSNKKFSPRG